MPITFWLFNNTPYDITIIAREKEINIKAGKYKKTTGLHYTFSINSNNESLIYAAIDAPLLHVHWTGWGPFLKRMFYTQLEIDGKIWVLSEKTKKPITKFIEQPEGFPLEPNT